MEDVLDLYQEAYDTAYPVVCFDESPCQLVSEVRTPIPARPGQAARSTTSTNARAPVTCSWCSSRFVAGVAFDVTPQRTAVDFAKQMRDLVDVHYPDAVKLISVVLDNLNTHTPAALYEALSRPRPNASCTTGVSLHPQARLVAEHGRVRVLGAASAVSRPAHRNHRDRPTEDSRLGSATQQHQVDRLLELHHCQGS